MNKRYQVFVSSTFQDLQDERKEVMQALLELDCIPCGMELFPAANDDQWTLIKRVIDDCDYYLVIVGGRYGSIGASGISYTEMEYRYALEQRKPIIAFLHRDPGKLQQERCETGEPARSLLKAFCELVKMKMVRFWDGPADLGSVVSRSVVNLMKTTPAVGWVRSDLVPTGEVATEILALRRRISELEAALQTAEGSAPAGAEQLAQGKDRVELTYRAGPYTHLEEYTYKPSWDALFGLLAPSMLDEASERSLENALKRFLIAKTRKSARGPIERCELNEGTLGRLIVQFRALGLIAKSVKARSVKDNATYWSLTPYGDRVITSLLAVRRDAHAPLAAQELHKNGADEEREDEESDREGDEESVEDRA